MGLDLLLQPIVGFGFAIHFTVPAIEVVFGPFVLRWGDSKWLANAIDDDDEDD